MTADMGVTLDCDSDAVSTGGRCCHLFEEPAGTTNKPCKPFYVQLPGYSSNLVAAATTSSQFHFAEYNYLEV